MMIAGFGTGYLIFKIRFIPNFTKLYFDPLEFGWISFFLSPIFIWIFIDAMAYYVHRMWHHKYLYKYIHKWHHYYKTPTAFTIVAMHPLEFVVYASVIASPIFFVPVYHLSFSLILVYLYYFGMIDHSGIHFTSIFPWQPKSIFHDDHHQFFHFNFGQNLDFWDRIHGSILKEKKENPENKYNKNNECLLL
jgi:Delta7-sterol 5-desaturase